jgi:hypothetical protein
MAKLLFVSDLHLRLNPPAGRIDNWEETVRNKLFYKQVISLINLTPHIRC